MKPVTSNWHAAAVFQGPSSNPSRRKSGCGPGLGELPEIRGFPFIISAITITLMYIVFYWRHVWEDKYVFLSSPQL